jgi:membrane protein
MGLIRNSFKEFGQNDPLRLAGATAFFTTFALPAILFIILQITRLVFTRQRSDNELFDKLTKYVGKQSATHLVNVLDAFERVAENPTAIILGFIFLLFVATTLFKVIKNSLNEIWDIRVVKKKSLKLTLWKRLRELIVILSAGVLFLLSLFLEGVRTLVNPEVLETSAMAALVLGNVISFIISLLIVTTWFGLIFCFLPDGRIPARIGFAGALITGILFNTGKLLLKWMLLDSNLNEIFGRSASVVLLLLFVFYSALIFYFGAAYTKVYAHARNVRIRPLPHASLYEIKEKG